MLSRLTSAMLSRLAKWHNEVDVGLRPREVFEGTHVNLYPFTRRAREWLIQNHDKFSGGEWRERDGYLELSERDCLALDAVVKLLVDAGLKIRFYGRLQGWAGKSSPSDAAHSTNTDSSAVQANMEFTLALADKILLSSTDPREVFIAAVGTLAQVIHTITPDDQREETLNNMTRMLRTYLEALDQQRGPSSPTIRPE
jgi:hypothetical protein